MKRLERIASRTEAPARRSVRRSTASSKEVDETAGEIEDKAVLDAALIAVAQALEPYEITVTACRFSGPKNLVTTRSCAFSRRT
jgi:ferritin-like metal-binding protein YciE